MYYFDDHGLLINFKSLCDCYLQYTGCNVANIGYNLYYNPVTGVLKLAELLKYDDFDFGLVGDTLGYQPDYFYIAYVGDICPFTGNRWRVQDFLDAVYDASLLTGGFTHGY